MAFRPTLEMDTTRCPFDRRRMRHLTAEKTARRGRRLRDFLAFVSARLLSPADRRLLFAFVSCQKHAPEIHTSAQRLRPRQLRHWRRRRRWRRWR